MRKKVNGKRVVSKIALFVSAVLLMTVTFHSCQQDEIILETEEMGLKSSLISEIDLDYPDEVNAGEDFDITFSSSCGRIMIERGFIAELDEYGEIINKIYTGLTFETENLTWEPVGEDVFENCGGATITENLAEPGTYVYRAKLNFKAEKNSGCPDCGGFVGNRFECFMITAVEGNQNEGTFTDERDGKVYKWVKIGNQIWMAENLAHNLEGSRVYNDDAIKAAIYGRLYTRAQATGGACPAGWHLPSMAEWQTLIDYIEVNNAVYGNVAKALASKNLWQDYGVPYRSYPGSSPECNNSSGFNGLPAGLYFFGWTRYAEEFIRTQWWSSDPGTNFEANVVGLAFNLDYVFKDFGSPMDGLSIRCVKDAE